MTWKANCRLAVGLRHHHRRRGRFLGGRRRLRFPRAHASARSIIGFAFALAGLILIVSASCKRRAGQRPHGEMPTAVTRTPRSHAQRRCRTARLRRDPTPSLRGPRRDPDPPGPAARNLSWRSRPSIRPARSAAWRACWQWARSVQGEPGRGRPDCVVTEARALANEARWWTICAIVQCSASRTDAGHGLGIPGWPRARSRTGSAYLEEANGTDGSVNLRAGAKARGCWPSDLGLERPRERYRQPARGPGQFRRSPAAAPLSMRPRAWRAP